MLQLLVVLSLLQPAYFQAEFFQTILNYIGYDDFPNCTRISPLLPKYVVKGFNSRGMEKVLRMVLELHNRSAEMEILKKKPEFDGKTLLVTQRASENELYAFAVNASMHSDMGVETITYLNTVDKLCGEEKFGSEDNDFAYAIGCHTDWLIKQMADYQGSSFTDVFKGSKAEQMRVLPRQKRRASPMKEARSYELHASFKMPEKLTDRTWFYEPCYLLCTEYFMYEFGMCHKHKCFCLNDRGTRYALVFDLQRALVTGQPD